MTHVPQPFEILKIGRNGIVYHVLPTNEAGVPAFPNVYVISWLCKVHLSMPSQEIMSEICITHLESACAAYTSKYLARECAASFALANQPEANAWFQFLDMLHEKMIRS